MTSARGQLDELGVRTPIGHALPAMFHDDAFAQRLCDGLDAVLAPVPSTIDNFWAYLDPAARPDRLRRMAGRLGRRRARPDVARGAPARARRAGGQAVRATRHGRGVGRPDRALRRGAPDGRGQRGSGVVGGTRRRSARVRTADGRRPARRRRGLRRRAQAGEYGGGEQAGARRPPGRDPTRRRRRTADLPPPPPTADPGPPEVNAQ